MAVLGAVVFLKPARSMSLLQAEFAQCCTIGSQAVGHDRGRRHLLVLEQGFSRSRAAAVFRLLCISISRISTSASTPRQRYMRLPATLTTISSS